MAYNETTGHLPFEKASKTGHIPLIQDPFVREQLAKLLPAGNRVTPIQPYPLMWEHRRNADSPIENVVACDGSYVQTDQENTRLAYIRVAALRLPVFSQGRLHPYQREQLIQSNSDSLQTVLPVELPTLPIEQQSLRLRRAIFETIQFRPQLLQTLRWLYTDGWMEQPMGLPSIRCPGCGQLVRIGTANQITHSCGCEVFVTDLFDWDTELKNSQGEADQHSGIPGRFMLVLEFLMLMSLIRETWQNSRQELGRTLFLHDGPLSIGGWYGHMLRPMGDFLREAERHGDRIYLCGVEKSGRFVRHLLAQRLEAPKEGVTFAVPSHGYVQGNIDGRPLETDHNYGERNVLGERVFVLLPENRRYVLSIPAQCIYMGPEQPMPTDLLGLEEILAVLPRLVTPVYDNALFPITQVNRLVSIAESPCGHLLGRFSESLRQRPASP